MLYLLCPWLNINCALLHYTISDHSIKFYSTEKSFMQISSFMWGSATALHASKVEPR